MTFNGGVYPTADFKADARIWTGYTSDGTSLLKVIMVNKGNRAVPALAGQRFGSWCYYDRHT